MMKYAGFGITRDIDAMLPEFINSLAFIVDDNPEKQGSRIHETEVVPLGALLEAREKGDVFVFILSDYYYPEIALELKSNGFVEGKDFIPAYDWFGNDEIPAPYKISTWDEYQKTWDYDGKRWDARKRLMASMLDFDEITSIADLGCGTMGLRKYLPENVVYHAVDYIRRDENTIVCDFNKHQFPDFGSVDCIFLSGVLRYVDDWRWLLDKSRECAKSMILTYFTGGRNVNLRQGRYRKRGYRHTVPIMEIVKYFEDGGWRIKDHSIFRITTQILYMEKAPALG